MRELVLLRHAKSSWDVPDEEDHERDLSSRGVKAAGRIGRFLKKNDLLPNLVLCSTAVRAQRTWELVAAPWKSKVEIKNLKGLYLASPSQILAIIRRQDPAHARLMVIGHNPGMASLAEQLFGTGDQEAAILMAYKYPTGGLAHFVFDVDDWTAVSPGGGRLLRFVQPRLLD